MPREIDRMPCSVQRVTCSALFRLLMVLLILSGGLSALRLGQRLLWLLTDFQPLGLWQEAVFLMLQEGGLALEGTLTMLTALGAVAMLTGRGGGRLLYRLERFRGWVALVGLLLCLGVTGALLWVCVRYRMSVTVLGIVGGAGLALTLVQGFRRSLHRNVGRILADVNMSVRRGSFVLGGGVQCCLRTQCFVLLLAAAVPAVLVMLQGAVVLWLTGFLQPVLGSDVTARLRDALTGSPTGVFSMYGVELLQSLLRMAELAVLGGLYGVYERAHDGGRSVRL